MSTGKIRELGTFPPKQGPLTMTLSYLITSTYGHVQKILERVWGQNKNNGRIVASIDDTIPKTDKSGEKRPEGRL